MSGPTAFPILESSLCESKPRHRCVDHLDTVCLFACLFARIPVVVGRNKRRLGTSGRDTGSPRRIGGTTNVRFHRPLTIKVHDAIDVIVALIVDYYGMFAIIAATIAN